MANTLAELVRYCREENTFGALLLCGEWGSGKTHLLENELPGQLGEKYLLIRISLFGEDSVDSVRRKVQTALDLHFPGAGLRPEPYPEGRKLILAFDDLERTNLSQVEILGCINEYCENLHIKTIVVANEEKIEGRSVQRSGTEDNRKREYLVYSEMKEKLIDRTVRLKMNDAGIVGSIIRQYRTSLEGYVDFLQESRDEIISLLDDCELKNIRSLRCGMQDFERIYELCSREGLPADQIRKYFTSFVLFTMLAKGGKITKSSTYGYGLNRLQEKYRGHYWNRYMPDCMKDGVMTGDWREEKIREQIRRTKEYMDGTMKPENRICSMTLLEMDDDTVAAGWKPFLGLAYAGRLSPEEYILLIRNLSEARAYGYRWPVKPDLKRLDQGTELAFQRICDSGEAPEPLRERMDEEAREKCTEAELRIAEKIYEFTDGRGYRNRTDRERLLAALRSRDEKALFGCRRCELAQIDEELVQEIAECYGALRSNQSRVAYADLILRILSTAGAEEYGKESRECLKKLGKMLKTRLTEQKDRPLECMAIRYFLEGTERL